MTDQCDAWELEFHDDGRNSHKFYRALVFNDGVFFHYGRIGAVGSLTPFKTASGKSAAARMASDQLDKKRGDGYEDSRSASFTVPTISAGHGGLDNQTLDRLFRSNSGLAANSASPPPVNAAREAKEAKQEEALKASLLARRNKLTKRAAAPAPTVGGSLQERLASALVSAQRAREDA